MTLPASAGTASGLCPLFKRQKIEEQIREFKPDVAALVSEDAAKDLKVRVADTGTKILSGSEGVCECAAYDKSDTVLNSVVGMAGLEPTLTAIKAHKNWRLPIKRLLLPAADLLWIPPKGKMSIFFPWIPNTRLYFRLFRGNLLTGR